MFDDPTRPRSSPRPIGPGARPADLEPHEAELAARVASLSRFEAGPELADRIRASVAADAVPAGRMLYFPGWALATAAALLMAVGAFAASLVVPSADPAPETTAAEPTPNTWVIEDPSMTLYHDLETFEGLGVAPGDVLALGDE